jgi:hypothetical protein
VEAEEIEGRKEGKNHKPEGTTTRTNDEAILSFVGSASFYFVYRFSTMVRISVLHSAQTGSEAHPASYPIGTGDSSPGVAGE